VRVCVDAIFTQQWIVDLPSPFTPSSSAPVLCIQLNYKMMSFYAHEEFMKFKGVFTIPAACARIPLKMKNF